MTPNEMHDLRLKADNFDFLCHRLIRQWQFCKNEQEKFAANGSHSDYGKGWDHATALAYEMRADYIKDLLAKVDHFILEQTPEMVAEAEKEVCHA